MQLFTNKHLEVLRNLQPEQFDGSKVEGFDQIFKNNLRQNVKKGAPRTPWQVKSDTAKGIGFEHYLMKTGIFSFAAPVVENPDEDLRYEDRQKDLYYNGKSIQVKAITKLYGTYAFLTDHMYSSVMKSIDLNDLFLFGLAKIDGSRDHGNTVFTYQPAFAIEASALKHILLGGAEAINVQDLYKRPDRYVSLHPSLYLAEAE